MQKEIKYTGFSASPSDYECLDGDLSTAVGLVPEDSTLKPLLEPKEEFAIKMFGKITVQRVSEKVFERYTNYDNPEHLHPYGWWCEGEGWVFTDTETPTTEDFAYRGYGASIGDNITNVELPEEGKLLYIHKGNGYTHYIVKFGSKIVYYYNTGTYYDKANIADLGGVTEAKAIGNTLILLNGGGMNYYLWKDGTYLSLGNHIPELPLSFGLQPERYPTPPTEANFEVRYTRDVDLVAIVNMSEDDWASFISTENKFKILTGEIGGYVDEGRSLLYDPNYIGAGTYSDELKNVVTQQVMAQVNRHIASGMYDNSTFVFPFFVRYAYRLYDGSLTMHSAPILMPCATHQNPYILVKPSIRCTVDSDHVYDTERIDDNHTKVIWHAKEQVMTCSLIMEMFRLDYITVAGNTLTNWKDIVTSVDVFVSAPLYTIEQSGLCTGVDVSGAGYTGHSVVLYNGAYQKVDDVTLFNTNAVQHGGQVKLPLRESHEQIINCSNFYFYYSIPTENLNTTQVRQILAKDKGYFRSLTSRELMTDDYDSHDVLIPKAMFPYNSRLSIANLQKLVAEPFNPLASLPYTTGGEKGCVIFIYLKINNTTKVLMSWGGGSYPMRPDAPVHYLYYPHTGAYQAKICWHYEGEGPFAVWDMVTVPLKDHPTLNGAYYFSDWNLTRSVVRGSLPDAENPITPISLPNKIYTSEVNNPFFFPVSGIITIGAATILDICSAARPLSEGQFGQFPLYAFTDEGVWALELSNDGTYKARQPITRDVCISPESITQMDTAVLFATDRGVMLISGSTSTCISDSLTSPSNFNPIEELKNLENVIEGYADENSLDYVPFLEYVEGCRMIYDYVHQRIIVFNPKKKYAYVYSLKSKQWGMMASSIKETTNSYPDALAVVQDGTTKNVVDYTEEEPEPEPEPGEEQQARTTKAVLVTRPLKLDAPDVLKTVNTVITRGNFQRRHVKTILYGSRDLINWQLIGSSVDHYLRYLHGTPYKYFRIVLLCDLTKGENVTGSTIEYTPRLTDQVR